MNNIVERILKHLPDVTDEECWVTPLVPGKSGYVCISDGTQTRTQQGLHRLVWEMHNAEPIPEGMVVMHSCDNRACCNPFHLSLGTRGDNFRDCVAKGRNYSHPQKFSRERAIELRKSGLTYQAIAEMLGVKPQSIIKAIKSAG